jgi:hypothetical protein
MSELTGLAKRGYAHVNMQIASPSRIENGERLMTRPTARRLFLPVLALPLALAACTVDLQDLSDETIGAVAVSGGGVTVDVLPTVSWPGSGFLGAVRVTNTGFGSPISAYEIVFKLGGSAGAGNAYNGSITAADILGNYTATSPTWLPFASIQVGQTFDTGFNGTGAFTDSTIVSVKVNGTTIPIGTGG